MTVTLDSFDPDNLSFSVPTKHEDRYITKIKYLTDDLIVQTPKVHATKTPGGTLEVMIKHDLLYNFLGSFDQKVVNILHENASQWFSQELTHDQCQEIYKRSSHMPFESSGSPKMFLKIQDALIYKFDEPLEKECIGENEELICLIKCTQLIFYRTYCVPHWEAVQIKIKGRKLDTSTYIIRDLEADVYVDEDDCIPEITNLTIN
jgi:hypothetical protein